MSAETYERGEVVCPACGAHEDNLSPKATNGIGPVGDGREAWEEVFECTECLERFHANVMVPQWNITLKASFIYDAMTINADSEEMAVQWAEESFMELLYENLAHWEPTFEVVESEEIGR